jgi:uncharacterized protein YdcH (DUF465 family)
MYENRIKHLTETHRLLDKQISDFEKSGNFQDENLSELKKKRLQFKDEIARLTKLQWEHDHETINHEDDR